MSEQTTNEAPAAAPEKKKREKIAGDVVVVGQKWHNIEYNRDAVVTEIDEKKGKVKLKYCDKDERNVSVSLKRMRPISTGWSLVSQPEAAAPASEAAAPAAADSEVAK